jgi:LacI family transcriptional regulator
MVSYVVNDRLTRPVSDAARQRILTAIAELGYVPDRTARNLRRRKTLTLACIIPDITNPFYPALLRGIQDVADDHGYDVLTYNTDGTREKEARCLYAAQQGHVDGVATVLFHQTARELRGLVERGIAVVRLEAGRKEAGPWPIDNLYVDNVAAAHAAVTHLIERGHRRIGVIGGPRGPRPARILGYLQALADHGIAPDDQLVQEGDFHESAAEHAMRRLLSLAFPPSAVFAVNDVMAIGALIAMREAGLRVPDDIAIAGFDDIPAAQYVTPSLTTIAQFPRRIGQRAATLLIERLRGDAPDEGRSEEAPFALIARAST